MKHHSFTSNFKRAASFLALLVVMIFIFDRLCFSLMFPLYDNWLRVGGALAASEVMLVGSSHIGADLDVKEISVKLGKQVSLFSVPGASLIPRYYAIKQRLELKNVAKPEMIVLETSRLVFHKHRYNDDVSEYLIPYWHNGYFNEFVESYAVKHADWLWQRVFQSYSLNGAFSRFAEPLNFVRFVAEKSLSQKNYYAFRNRMRGGQVLCNVDSKDEKDLRPTAWALERKQRGYDNVIDPEHVKYLKMIVDLARSEKVKLVFFDPPFFHFKGEEKNTGFENVDLLLKSIAANDIEILNFAVPNNACLFADEGHLTAQGQGLLTRQFISKYFN
jgi:hypothetical protein